MDVERRSYRNFIWCLCYVSAHRASLFVIKPEHELLVNQWRRWRMLNGEHGGIPSWVSVMKAHAPFGFLSRITILKINISKAIRTKVDWLTRNDDDRIYYLYIQNSLLFVIEHDTVKWWCQQDRPRQSIARMMISARKQLYFNLAGYWVLETRLSTLSL